MWISNIKYQIVLAETELAVPLNGIALHTEKITPEILPLIELNQDDIDHIIAQIPGGIENVQDIYALSPLQDGILFHHLLASEGDPYLLVSQMNFDNRALLDHYLAAMQRVIDRHDILRTAFVWERLSSPAQVVLRHSPLAITETSVDPGDGPVGEQLLRRFSPRHRRINLGQAPLQRFVTAEEADGSWHVLLLLHHLIADHSTFESMNAEILAFMGGTEHALAAPQPFRNLVAQARLGVSLDEHERFFRSMLRDIDEPTAPFGLLDVHSDGSQVQQSHCIVPQALNDRLRTQARRLGVNLVSLCHLAWGRVE